MSCSPAVSDGTCEAACACRITRVRHSSANSEVISGTDEALQNAAVVPWWPAMPQRTNKTAAREQRTQREFTSTPPRASQRRTAATSTARLPPSPPVKQGTSGPAGRLAVLNASRCLGFRRNSGEFRYSTELKRHNKRAGERPARHHIPPARRDTHGRFCPFPSCCLPASCLLCGRLPHRAPLALPARPRADKTTLLLSRHQHTHTLLGGGVHPATFGRMTESRPLLPSRRQRTSTRQNNKSCASRSTHVVVDMRSTVLW